MQTNPMAAAVVLLASALALLALVVPASADAISDWAAKADAVATEQRDSPRSRARTIAIVNVAMFEAINAVERGDTPHKLNISADRDTSIEAAAAAAAHDVLVALYPDRAPDLSPALGSLACRNRQRCAEGQGICARQECGSGNPCVMVLDGTGEKRRRNPRQSSVTCIAAHDDQPIFLCSRERSGALCGPKVACDAGGLLGAFYRKMR